MENKKEEKIEEKYLPSGTVLKLKNAEATVMITGYAIKPKGKVMGLNGEIENNENTCFDYIGCLYPEGIVSTDVNMLFNHEDIEKIYFMGYQTENQKGYSRFIKATLEKMKKEKETKENKEKENQQ